MEWLKMQKLNNLRTEHNFSTKILNLCFRWHILRSYRFVVEVTFKKIACSVTTFLLSNEKVFDRSALKNYLVT